MTGVSGRRFSGSFVTRFGKLDVRVQEFLPLIERPATRRIANDAVYSCCGRDAVMKEKERRGEERRWGGVRS